MTPSDWITAVTLILALIAAGLLVACERGRRS